MVMYLNLLLTLSLVLWINAEIRPKVTTISGVFRGTWKNSTKGNSYASFEGIQYGMPPTGEYRFKSPRPVEYKSGVLDASKLGPPCLQYNGWHKWFEGSEDCLTLNVYTPKLPTTANPNPGLPVIVFIHGGAFLYGSNGPTYDPARLMGWDAVFVSINYRLGALGFLSTGDLASPGNYGLKDQAEAMRWVQSNIGSFGGDPQTITLAGHSAGGASVHCHLLAEPVNRVSFKRVIALSGSAFNPWAIAEQPAKHAKDLAAILDCPTANSHEMVDCLKEKSGSEITQAQSQLYDPQWPVHLFTPFTPTMEPIDAEKPFLTQHPVDASRAGHVIPVPMLATIVSDEGLYPAAMYLTNASNLQTLETQWERLASSIFHYNDTLPAELQSAAARRIKQFYLDGKPVSQETYPNLVKALSDGLFGAGIGKMVQEHVLRTAQPTYLYNYAFRGEQSLSLLLSGDAENYGVSHGDDIIHVFNMADFKFMQSNDLKMIDLLINLIVSFATTGEPKLPEGSSWKPIVPEKPDLNFLQISSPDDMNMVTERDFGNRTFWDGLLNYSA